VLKNLQQVSIVFGKNSWPTGASSAAIRAKWFAVHDVIQQQSRCLNLATVMRDVTAKSCEQCIIN